MKALIVIILSLVCLSGCAKFKLYDGPKQSDNELGIILSEYKSERYRRSRIYIREVYSYETKNKMHWGWIDRHEVKLLPGKYRLTLLITVNPNTRYKTFFENTSEVDITVAKGFVYAVRVKTAINYKTSGFFKGQPDSMYGKPFAQLLGAVENIDEFKEAVWTDWK